MVHIPFLNIEVPEPRVAQLVPDAVQGLLRVCTKAMDAAQRATHPLPPEVEELFVQDVVASFPREIQKVFGRGEEGRHKDEDQLSSELEEASFDYYRRMIRTAAVGETEEDQEDVTAYKLGLDRPSAQEQVWQLYRQHHGVNERDPVAAMAVEGSPEERAAIEALMASCRQEEVAHTLLQEDTLRSLRTRVRSGVRQTTGAATNAGLGLVLGVAAFKGVGLLAQQLLRRLRKTKTKTKKAKAAPASVSRAVPLQAQAQQQQAQAAPQQQQQQQQQQQEAAAAAAQAKARTRTTTRKR